MGIVSEFTHLIAHRYTRGSAALCLAVLLIQMAGVGARAAETVGSAVKILNSVQGSFENRSLAVSDQVFAEESLRAGAASHGEIILTDDSKVIVGENSEVKLDNFVVSDGSFTKATLNVAKGAFRFISGGSDKGIFTIKTPLSSIGVRGTVFDVYVGEGGVTNVVLLQGAVRVCTLTNRCLLAERSCDIIEVRSRTDIEEQPFLRSNARTAAEERQEFQLLSGQNRFDRRFRANTALCNARAAVETLRNDSRTGDKEGPQPEDPSAPEPQARPEQTPNQDVDPKGREIDD